MKRKPKKVRRTLTTCERMALGWPERPVPESIKTREELTYVSVAVGTDLVRQMLQDAKTAADGLEDLISADLIPAAEVKDARRAIRRLAKDLARVFPGFADRRR